MRLIDADRLLEERMVHTYYHLPNGDVAIPIIDIEHAPTVGEWIPCSERLPENDNDVLVQMNDGSMMVDFTAASSNGWFWAELGDEPIAWMPLPEPWRPGND